jgi:hypothetical protein
MKVRGVSGIVDVEEGVVVEELGAKARRGVVKAGTAPGVLSILELDQKTSSSTALLRV